MTTMNPPQRQRISNKAEAFQKRGRELTNNGKLCISKALLGSCVPSLTADQVYAEYFKPFTLVDEDTNLSCLKARPNQEKKIRNSMFELRQPTKDPAFFNMAEHTDLNRLAAVLNCDIVVYYTSETFEKFFEIYHDFRCFNNKVEIPAEDYETGGEEESTFKKKIRKLKNTCLYYVLTVERKLFKFEESLDEVLERLPGPFFSAQEFRVRNLRYPDYGELLARALNLPPPNFPITSLLELTFSVDRLWELWRVKIILVSFCKLNFNQKQVRNVSRRMQPKFCFFFHLGIVGRLDDEAAEVDDAEGKLAKLVDDISLAVCFYGPNLAHILKDDYRRAVIEEYKKTSRRDKPKSTNFLNLPSVNLDERREALAKVEAKKKLKQAAEGKKISYGDTRTKVCVCPTCRQSDKFDINMGRGGPERLCVYSLCLSELLKMLGFDTDENLNIVEQLCSLSMASMYIESMTMEVDLEPPAREGAGLFYGVVDDVKLQGHFKKVQKPVMIAHLDQLSDENDVKVFTIESDAEEDIYKMMREYWKFVAERHEAVRK